MFFFLQSSKYVSNEQSCLKTTGLFDDFILSSSLFHFLYFIFSAPISYSLCFPIFPALLFFFFFGVLSHPLSRVVEKLLYTYIWGFPGSSVVKKKKISLQRRRCKRCGFNPWVEKIPWRRQWLPTPVFLPGEFHEQRSLVGSFGYQRIRHD